MIFFKKYYSGIGTDFHLFDQSNPKNKPLMLGCIPWENTPRLLGHSDGDVVVHSIIDALFGAAGLGDIGAVFGVNTNELQGASGKYFLQSSYKILLAHKVKPISVCTQVIGNKPKISTNAKESMEVMSKILHCQVSLTGTTTDSMLSEIGNGKGLMAISNALIKK